MMLAAFQLFNNFIQHIQGLHLGFGLEFPSSFSTPTRYYRQIAIVVARDFIRPRIIHGGIVPSPVIELAHPCPAYFSQPAKAPKWL